MQREEVYVMGRVSKKQLGRRRRTALLIVLAIAAAVMYLVFFRADSKSDDAAKTVQSVSGSTASSEDAAEIVIETTAPETTAATTTLTTPTEPAVLPVRRAQLDAQPVLQNPELPTGCEVTALTTALNYLGYPVDKVTLADKYLIQSDPYLTTFGEAFVGSPHDANAWGCYAPVIAETAENYIAAQGGTEQIQDLTGCSLKTLLNEVANGTPVITWVTISLTSRVEERYYWTTPSGEDAVFLINEHCVLLCGYDLDANTVTVCDPLEGKIEYDMDKFEDRYQLVYQQAVVIRRAETVSAADVSTPQ